MEPLVEKSKPTVYYSIVAGKFVEKIEKQDSRYDEAIERVNKNNETIRELIFGAITGDIIGLYYNDNGKYQNYSIVFGGSEANKSVSLIEDTSYANNALARFPNVDFSKPVKLKPYSITKDEKTRCGITVWQDDKKVDDYFVTSNEPGSYTYSHGYPESPDRKTATKTDWKKYFLDVAAFLRKYTLDYTKPRVKDAFDQRELDSIEGAKSQDESVVYGDTPEGGDISEVDNTTDDDVKVPF